MLDIGKKLGLYVSPNLKKDETAHRIARGILDTPLAVLCSLSKSELLLLNEFVQAGPNRYIAKKMRKTQYEIFLGTDLRGFRHQRMENADAGQRA